MRIRCLSARKSAAMTLTEVMIASALGSLVLACVASLTSFGSRSSIAMVNYTDLDSHSRHAADVVSHEIREATEVIDFQSSPTGKWLTLTNSDKGTTLKLSWAPATRVLQLERTGQAPLNVLTECDRWDFALYQRTPYVTPTNLLFFSATNNAGQLDLRLCKLINMTWKCSRTILQQAVNTESVQAAQIVLRNKM